MSCRVTSHGLRRNILRNEILWRAWHAVVVSPAIDHRELRPPIAMSRRRLRRLPFQRRRAPGIAVGLGTFEEAPDHVVKEKELRDADDQRGDGDDLIRYVRRGRSERRLCQRIVAPRDAEEAAVTQR